MSKTLLLADDSVTIQRVVELTFAHEDVRVVSVSDGERAMQWLESERADVVLVDVGIPEVDGYAIAEHVKKSRRHRGVPVLLMAGALEPVDEDRSRAIGCDGVIVKPFEPQHLVDRVKELLADQHDSPGKTQGPDAVASSSKPPAPAALKKVMTMPAAGPTADELRRESTPRTTSLSSPPAPTPPSAPVSAPVSSAPVELELPDRPAWEPEPKAAESAAPAPAPAAAAPAAPAPAPAPKVNLVNAFTALLAAEKSSGPSLPAQSPAAPVVPDAAIEEAVRRVLARMTDDLVRRIVLDTAERLIREEIEKIKADPE
jgi:DNA-binding response OmpR family regulator